MRTVGLVLVAALAFAAIYIFAFHLADPDSASRHVNPVTPSVNDAGSAVETLQGNALSGGENNNVPDTHKPETSSLAPAPHHHSASADEHDYAPPAVHMPELAAFVNRHSSAPRVTPDLHNRIPSLSDPKDIAAVASVLTDHRDDDTVRHEAAELLRRSGYKGLTRDLTAILDSPDENERFRSWAVQHLGQNALATPRDKKVIVPVLKDGLADRHPAVRRESLLALHRLNVPAASSTAQEWLHAQDSESVRDLAIRVVRERDLREELPRIRELAASPSVVTRIAALVTLAEWGDSDSRDLMEEAAASDTPRLKRCGEMALKVLDRVKSTETKEQTVPPRIDDPDVKEEVKYTF